MFFFAWVWFLTGIKIPRIKNASNRPHFVSCQWIGSWLFLIEIIIWLRVGQLIEWGHLHGKLPRQVFNMQIPVISIFSEVKWNIINVEFRQTGTEKTISCGMLLRLSMAKSNAFEKTRMKFQRIDLHGQYVIVKNLPLMELHVQLPTKVKSPTYGEQISLRNCTTTS